MAIGWSGYFDNALAAAGVHLPGYLLKVPGDGGWINLPAAAIVLVLAVLLAVGVRQSARFNAAMVLIKLAAIGIFITVAAFNANPANWTPFSPLIPALGIAFYVYLMASLPLITWERFLIWLAIGMAVYFGYSRKRSLLAAD